MDASSLLMAIFRRSRSPFPAVAQSARAPACGAAARRLVHAIEDQSGQTLIEMAVVLPVFFLLLFGIFNFAIILFGYGNASFASRLGARYASLHSSTSLAPSTPSVISTLVQPYLFAAPASGTTIATTYGLPSNTNIIGSTVSVSVKIVYPAAIPFFSVTQITVGSTAQRTIMR